VNDPLYVVFAANRAFVPYVSAAITSLRHNKDSPVNGTTATVFRLMNDC